MSFIVLLYSNLFSIIFIVFLLLKCCTNKRSNISNLNKWFMPNYKSQFNQDIIMYYKYFYNITNGFFVEIGAFDGVAISNTYLFEKNLNWKGILIEGGRNNCKKLISNSKIRTKSIIICSPICISNYTFYNDRGTGGGIVKWNNKKEAVQCNTLKNITSYYKVKHIDFFSLDVEGSELEVLKTFDFNVKVSYWLIEWPNLSISTKIQIEDILYKNNYIKRNDYVSEIDVLFSYIN